MVTCFRRFASPDKVSYYYDRFIWERIYYDDEITHRNLKISELKMSSLKGKSYYVYYSKLKNVLFHNSIFFSFSLKQVLII
jgi:hypothetical protein